MHSKCTNNQGIKALPQKKRQFRSRKLLLRKKINQTSSDSSTQKKLNKKTRDENRFKFTKTSVAKLDHPPKGERNIYRDTLTPHLCLRVTPTAKTFYWEKTVRGSQKRVTIGRFPEINVEQARILAADIAADYAKGTDVQAERRDRRSVSTLGDLWQDYRENRRRKVKGKYSKALDYQWKSYFKKWENLPLTEISYHKARHMILRIRKKAPYHANRIQRHGQAMFNYATKQLRWKGENPFDFDLVPERNRARKVRLRDTDMPNFMKGLDACSEGMRLLFLSSLYTGRRMGEVQAMRWIDLDLESAVWTLPETKSNEVQTAFIPTPLVELLLKRRESVKSPWVFPSPSKSGHVEEIKGAWAKVRKKSGLHHLQARDLRRTLASWAQDVNVPIAAVQAQLGHADFATTAKHYTAINESVQKAALDATVASMIEASS